MKKKILIVESDAIIAMGIEACLHDPHRMSCRIVATGQEAVCEVKRGMYDLILSEVVLSGGMDGIEAVARIRTFSDIPVIFVTTCTDIDTHHHAIALKSSMVVRKPFEVDHMLYTVEKILLEDDREREFRKLSSELETLVESTHNYEDVLMRLMGGDGIRNYSDATAEMEFA